LRSCRHGHDHPGQVAYGSIRRKVIAMTERTLYERLAEQVGAGDSKIIAAIFETLAGDEEARVLLAAAPPASVEEISERTGMGAGDVEKMIDPLFRKGLLFKAKKKEGTRYYRARHLLQLHDSTAVANDASREMLDLWKRFMETDWADFSKKVEEILPGSVIRVIPVNVSIDSNSQILAFEDVRELVASARSLAVTKCSCRVISGGCGKPLEVCLQLDRAADYAIERGTGKRLSKEEALSMLKMCEEEHLVHVAENKRASGNVICNCCADCCMNWASLRTGLGKFCAPSRFRALVGVEACNGCQECLDVCFFDALGMDSQGGVAAVDAAKCMGCGLCQAACPIDAISMQVARPEEFVPG